MRANLRRDEQRLRMVQNALFFFVGEHRVYDHDVPPLRDQLLQLSDRRIFKKAFLAEAQLQAEEIYLPLCNSGGKMDQDRKKICP